MIFSNLDEASSLLMPEGLYKDIFNVLGHSFTKKLRVSFENNAKGFIAVAESKDSQSSVTDCRLKYILMRNFRGYDKVSAYEGAHYGIEFLGDDKKVCPKYFILGRNGVGKSTVFNAAEYLFTGNISEANYRNISDKEAYMAGSDRSSDDIIALANEDKVVTRQTSVHLPLSRFFISENSILEASRYIADNDNWYNFFCEMLGVGGVNKLVNKILPDIKIKILQIIDIAISQKKCYDKLMLVIDIKQTVKEENRGILDDLLRDLRLFQEAPDYQHLSDIGDKLLKSKLKTPDSLRVEIKTANRKINDIIRTAKEQPAVSGGKSNYGITDNNDEKISQILENIKDSLSQFSNNLNEILENGYNELSLKQQEGKLMSDFVLYGGQETMGISLSKKEADLITKQIDDYCMKAQKALNAYVSKFADKDFKNALEGMFNNHFLSRHEIMAVDLSKLSNDSITIRIGHPDGSHPEISVNKYFNTFRFRLFFLSVQSLLCIRMMQYAEVYFPLFFDDVFYANDYVNKMQLTHFFSQMDKYVAKYENVRDHFQLIFFSHDEQLIKVIHDRLKSEETCKFARMLDGIQISSNKMCIKETEGIKYKYCPVTFPILKN